MVDYCKDNDTILQPVVAYNHTMQARVEGAIGCSKQYSRVAIVSANMPTRFWPDATLDFTRKKNALWAKRDEHGQLSSANDCMQPAFASSYRTVAIPFGSPVTGYLPRAWEHPLVKNRSFVEGTYLRGANKKAAQNRFTSFECMNQTWWSHSLSSRVDPISGWSHCLFSRVDPISGRSHSLSSRVDPISRQRYCYTYEWDLHIWMTVTHTNLNESMTEWESQKMRVTYMNESQTYEWESDTWIRVTHINESHTYEWESHIRITDRPRGGVLHYRDQTKQ